MCKLTGGGVECGGGWVRLIKLSSTEQIYGVLSCSETRKDQRNSPRRRGVHHSLSPWNRHTPILAPEHGAESKHSEGDTHPRRSGRGRVTHPFGRNPALGCHQRGCKRLCVAPTHSRGPCKPLTSRAIRPPTAAALDRSGFSKRENPRFSLLATSPQARWVSFGPFLPRSKKGYP